ncbi:MAG: SRPBCC family protein [Bdellovibrionota bacterium]
MLKKICGILFLLVAIFLAVAAMQPEDFRVTRSKRVAGHPEVVFAHVNDLRQWDAWSPWAKLDPNAKSSFEGPSAGVGAAMTWDGNGEVGAGKMTITESSPAQLVRLRLDFEKPFRATNQAELTFAPEGSETLVTWTMTGKNNLIGKAISLVMNCDKMIGGYFEKGLSNLDAVVRAEASGQTPS